MGNGNWSRSFWDKVNAMHRAAGTDPFAHTAAIRAGHAPAVVHPSLDPRNVKWRESRDSADHPNSNPIAVMFDVTGSMGDIPMLLQEKLGGLMTLLVKKSYIADPQILFAGVGDATCDQVPLQVGQFESDNRMDTCLTNIFIERGGGGQKHESYDLAMYFMARKAALDSLEKRGKKGYLFMIGDELYRDRVSRDAVRALTGDTIEADLPIEQVVRELKAKFEVYFIIPLANSSHGRDPEIRRKWSDLLGKDRVILVEGMDNICEVIGLAIGFAEGTLESIEDGISDLGDTGAGAVAKSSVSRALAPFASRAVAGRLGKASGTLPDITGPAGGIERL